MDDAELLARYARSGDEEAFTELVRRSLPLVYSAALRQVRRPELAEEVAQVDEILAPLGLQDSSREWRKMISGQRLWYFESRDASAWLMI